MGKPQNYKYLCYLNLSVILLSLMIINSDRLVIIIWYCDQCENLSHDSFNKSRNCFVHGMMPTVCFNCQTGLQENLNKLLEV